jgi:hypothetical protein
MKVHSILIACFLSSSLFGFCMILPNVKKCDPTWLPIQVNIQGAHIVSAGAYFRFWIKNYYNFPINVTMNGANTVSIPPQGSIDYDVIAPQISLPYEKVTYTFLFTTNVTNSWSQQAQNPINYTVLLLNSAFLQIFDPVFPILIAIALVIIAIVFIVVAGRRRTLKNTPERVFTRQT